jgi:hypothetical protein
MKGLTVVSAHWISVISDIGKETIAAHPTGSALYVKRLDAGKFIGSTR